MRVALTARFERDVTALSDQRRAALFDAVRALSTAVGAPHIHAGLGIRKIHRSGIWEARVGLGLRLVFTVEADTATLVRVGGHDEVRRYLRSL